MMGIINALTNTATGIVNVIKTPVVVKNTFTNSELNTNAIWDTGATNCCITKSCASILGLKPISRTNVNGVHGIEEVNVYYINITLNNEQITLDRKVTECSELSPDNSVGLLIGMDLITLGDFAITNYDGRTKMSFRVPSQQHIDFVDGIRQSKPIVNAKIPGRNDPCGCGSNKKYKNCCGKNK